MEYTIIVNDKSYDLPKKNLATMEKLDQALKVDSIAGLTLRKKYEKLHTFVKDMVGEENAEEMLGSSNLNEIDLSQLSVIVLQINDAYEKPLNDYNAERMRDKMGVIPFKEISGLANAAQVVAKNK